MCITCLCLPAVFLKNFFVIYVSNKNISHCSDSVSVPKDEDKTQLSRMMKSEKSNQMFFSHHNTI